MGIFIAVSLDGEELASSTADSPASDVGRKRAAASERFRAREGTTNRLDTEPIRGWCGELERHGPLPQPDAADSRSCPRPQRLPAGELGKNERPR